MRVAQSDYLRLTDRRTDGDVWTAFFAGDCVNGTEGGVEQPIAGDVVERVTDADLSVVNLEAPVPTDAAPIEKTGPTKQAAAGTPATLRSAGFNVAALANNHTMDYGPDGLARTIAACHESSLLTCGAGRDVEDAMAPVNLTVNGVAVAVFDFCEREFGVTEGEGPGTAWISHPTARDRVAEEADRSDVVVVLAHGGVEYVPFPSPRRQEQLRGFAEAGADLVVGHHPHVPQGWEVHEGTPVFYSLGNFLFRQPRRPATQWGLGLSVEFAGPTPIAVELVPTVLDRGRVKEFARGNDREARLEHLHRLSAITGDPDALRSHWQAVAARIFEQRYANWLRAGTGAGLSESIRHPVRSLDPSSVWDGSARQSELLILLNLIRNESHRDVIETTLGLRTGELEDRRTREVRAAVEELLEWTEDQSLSEPASATATGVRRLLSRLGSAVPGVGGDPRVPNGSS